MHLAVLGGGITGLAAAHRARERARAEGRPVRVTLYEASARLGGVIGTRRQDDFILEEGPDSILTEKPAALALAQRIGLGPAIIATQPAYRRSYIVRDTQLHATPEGFHLLAPANLRALALSGLVSIPGKIRMACELFVPSRLDDEDESLGAFVTRRLGREALERLAEPMVAGIYGGADPWQLSLDATFPRFHDMERRHGSVIRALWAAGAASGAAGAASGAATSASGGERDTTARGPRYGLFASFTRGMQMLPDALSTLLHRDPEVTVRLSTPVVTVAPRDEGGWRVVTAAGADDVDAVACTLTAPAASTVLRETDAELSDSLRGIPYAPAATLTLAYRLAQVLHPLDAAGFVVPAREGLSILGCTFTHRKYAGRVPEQWVVLRAFHGTRSAHLDDAAMIARTHSELALLLGIDGQPAWSYLTRYAQAMPHYHVGHRDRVAAMRARAATHPGLALAGNAYDGIGLPDCIASGEGAVDVLLETLVR